MSEQQQHIPGVPHEKLTIADLARQQHAQVVRDPRELAAEVWASDTDLDFFLADLRASRNTSIA